MFSEHGSARNGCHVSTLGELPARVFDSPPTGHSLRHNFSRSIRYVFGDCELAGLVRRLEDKYELASSMIAFLDGLAGWIADRSEGISAA